MSGSNRRDQNGTYGELGIAHESNIPSSREGAFSWIDLNGNVWIFGGHISGKANDYSDLNFV
jgi:hypothetical protein